MAYHLTFISDLNYPQFLQGVSIACYADAIVLAITSLVSVSVDVTLLYCVKTMQARIAKSLLSAPGKTLFSVILELLICAIVLKCVAVHTV